MAGDEETGVCVIELVEELDAGPIAAQGRFPIGPEDDAGVVFRHARGLSSDMVEEAMANTNPAPQSHEGVTYAEKITPADRELDWSRPPQDLHNRIRALSPHIGARGVVEGRSVIVWRSRVVDGTLELLEVQPEGRRRMTYDEFLRGLRG
jgi:methionyl-tRNA formyltransferase